MTGIAIKRARAGDLEQASALCLRSKAHWGYDEAFIQGCREELTLRPRDLCQDHVALALSDARLVGVVHVALRDNHAEIEKLFVEPEVIGRGVGRALFEWARGIALDNGAGQLHVASDPQAHGFYEILGFTRTGEEPSGSISGRMLATFAMTLVPPRK